MLVIWKELGDIPDSSATAAIITATSSPSSTAGAAGAAAGLAAGAADLGAGAAGAFPLPSIAATILEITKMTSHQHGKHHKDDQQTGHSYQQGLTNTQRFKRVNNCFINTRHVSVPPTFNPG